MSHRNAGSSRIRTESQQGAKSTLSAQDYDWLVVELEILRHAINGLVHSYSDAPDIQGSRIALQRQVTRIEDFVGDLEDVPACLV